MNKFIQDVMKSLDGSSFKIVFPEGTDLRILEAACRLKNEGVLNPILLGNPDTIRLLAAEHGFDIEGIEIIDPSVSDLAEKMVPLLVEKRKGKLTLEAATELIKQVNYFGTMMVEMNLADGLVSGADHATADTVRPALQIIKTKPGVQKTSGIFIMIKGDTRYLFADCAINVAPTKEDLAEIAIESAQTAVALSIEPRIAMLSFSSHGSGIAEESLKVADATALVKERAPHLVVDGEIQFDAAIIPTVAKKKVPTSPLQGNANVFVFPSLDAGNISYKIAQRLGGLEAIGPILQGLNKPVNDLSRGCTADDAYCLALLTALQCKQLQEEGLTATKA